MHAVIQLLRRLVYALRARWTWRRGIRARTPFCWGCGHLFGEDANVPAHSDAHTPTLCGLCLADGWVLRGSNVAYRPDGNDYCYAYLPGGLEAAVTIRPGHVTYV